MKVSRERLQIIGRMIGVLREEKRQNKQNSWTQIKFCENICSPNTLKSIESGKVGRSDDIYEQLLEKLGLKYGEYPLIDEAIEQVVNSLRTAIEFFNIDTIKKYALKGMKILENASAYVYYSDLYEIMSDIYNYYVDDILIDEQKAEHYLHLVGLFYPYLQDILKILIFAGIKRKCLCNLKIYKRYVELLDMENSNFLCLKINLMHYYHTLDERAKMIEMVKALESDFKESNNLIRLLDTYNNAMILMGYIDKSLAEAYIPKVLEIIKSDKVPLNKKSETFTNIGDCLHRRKDYVNALKYFKMAVKEGCEDLIDNYILIADCQNHLSMQIEIPDLDKKYKAKYPREVRVIFNYFLLYNDDVPASIKQSVLMKRIAPLLEDEGIIEIFSYELKKLVKTTKGYKDLSVFDEIIMKNKNFIY